MKKIVSFLALNLALGGGAIAAGTQIINDQGEIKAAPTTFTENSWIYALQIFTAWAYQALKTHQKQ